MNIKFKTMISIVAASFFFFAVGYGSWIAYNPNSNTITANVESTQEKKVCYIADSPNVYYTSIEKALNVANSEASSKNKKNVVVIPSINKQDCTVPSVFIFATNDKKTVTIGSNVSLTIACTEDDAKKGSFGHQKDEANNKTGRFADCEEDYSKYVKSNIGLAANTTLRIESGGNLNIGGTTGVGKSSQRPTGHTTGDFCQLTLFSNSKIDCSGTIDLYGYIKESETDNVSSVYMNDGSNLYLPFVIYDYRGGSYSSYATSKSAYETNSGFLARPKSKDVSFPFNIFDLPNIQSVIHIFYGAKIFGRVDVYTSLGGHTIKEPEAVGAEGLFRLEPKSEIKWKYNSPSPKYSYVYDLGSSTNKGYKNVSKTSVSIEKGTLSVSAMSFDVGISIKTSDYYLPLCYKYSLEVKAGASLKLSEKVKFLSGSSLKIDNGASAIFSKDIVFYQKYVDMATTGVKGADIYPQTLGSAKLINDGNLTINSRFGGFIDTEVDGANVIIGNGFSETISTEAIVGQKHDKIGLTVEGTSKKVTTKGAGNISLDVSNVVKKTFVKGKEYISAKTGSTYYWKGDSSGSTSIEETIS